jgi:CheY-like chemotaxis protein
VVNNGEVALDFIYHKGKYQDKKLFPRPDLVILDIKMPRLDGFSVLDKIKDDLEYGSIPVIMLTSSKYEEDMIKSFKKGACAYISKPMDSEEFSRIIEGFDFFWHEIQKLNEGTSQKSQE